MHTFKLTPKPQSDYRLEVNEITARCKLEKHGYRHNKIIYGFSNDLSDVTELLALGLTIEEIPFEPSQLSLANDLVERSRAKSKVDHLKHDQVENGAENEQEEAIARQKLMDLNNKIQATKEALGIAGTLKTLTFQF